jgi:maltose O-acetyltransferase
MNEFLKGLGFYFINHILNKVPSRRIRMFFYSFLSKGRIHRSASIGLGVRILDIRNVSIGEYSNINFDSLIDGRGAKVNIGNNVDIAPQVNIWTLEHEPDSETHSSRGGEVSIGDFSWIANRVIVLPGTIIEPHHVCGAGSVMKGHYGENSISMSSKAKVVKRKTLSRKDNLRKLRLFR